MFAPFFRISDSCFDIFIMQCNKKHYRVPEVSKYFLRQLHLLYMKIPKLQQLLSIDLKLFSFPPTVILYSLQ